MPLKDDAEIEITALSWVPAPAQGVVKDLRIRWALEEAGLDYRVRLLPLERPPEYVKEQPFNQVPCFDDGKVQIFESGAILQYLGEQSEILLPRDPLGKFRAIQWTFSAVSSVEPFIQFRALLNGPFAALEWAEPAKPTFDHYARLRLGQIADRLGDNQWLEGDRFTIGDLMMVSVLRIADRSGQLADLPTLAALVKRGEARPAFQQALSDQLAAFRENQPEGVAA
ncbi:MAG: glutathione S-transferase family protein [Pseudomonadota bacterium]